MTRSTFTDERLADFLRRRRASADPDTLGVVYYGQRRVPGLRREELAELAGVSLAYYVRLEQGSATNPSPQVLDSLARALRLGDVERCHLYHLAGATAAPAVQPHELRAVQPRGLRPGLAALLDQMADIAVVALSPIQDIVGWNRLGHAVLAGHLDPAAPYGPHPPNKVSLLFTDPPSRALHREWEHEAHLAVASLRYVTGALGTAQNVERLVGELSTRSNEFARLWAEHPVDLCSSGIKRFHHPVVGALDLHYEMLHLPEEDGYRLILMHAVPGSPDADALRLLASTTVTA